MSRYDRVVACVLILLMISSSAVAMLAPAQLEVSRTGDSGNEPVGGYTEWNDTFRIYHQDGTDDTDFVLDETLYLNITTDRVVDGSNANVLRILDDQGTAIDDIDPAFTQTDSAAPGYSYEASVLLDSANYNAEHYRVEVELDDGNNVFETADTIIVDGGANPEKYIKTYSDDNFTTTAHTFNENDIIYIEIYSGGANIRKRDCDLWFANYQGDSPRRAFNQLTNSTAQTVGDYVQVAFDLNNDLNKNAVGFTGGWWYSITITLASQAGDIIVEWAAQVYIYDFPAPTDVQALPATVNRNGVDTTSIFTEFRDMDAAGPDDFTVTLQVREPDDATVLTLVNAQTNGNGGLVVTDNGNGFYNASYTWDPIATQTLGLYDLYANVTDTQGFGGISGFAVNQDELEVFDTTVNPPVIIANNTTADPPVISRAGTATTTISTNFTDIDDHAADEFLVSFKVRDEANAEIVLVDSQADGGAAVTGGTVSVVKHVGAAGTYTASYTWDPNDTVALGLYDLYFNVTDPSSQFGEDIFANNPDELELIAGSTAPVIENVTAVPAQIDKMGAVTTTLGVQFTDADAHPGDDYNISISVRDPNGTVIPIAIDVGNGGTGEFGETLGLAVTPGGFIATMAWDPPDTALVGLYDLYAKVTDPTNVSTEEGFDLNLDELNVTTSDLPPELFAGDVMANPAIVPRIGNGFSTISVKFTDEDNDDPAIYNVTFKVRDTGNQEYILVDNKGDGGAGEFGGTVTVKLTGNHFTASYDWDPPETQALGLYDLYFWLTDGLNTIEDIYDNNLDELEVTDVPSPLDVLIGDTYADPDTVNRNGTSYTTIISNFTDTSVNATNVTAFMVTFRVRSPTGLQIDLAVDKRSGEIGEGGGLVTVANVTGGWQASVTWDPGNAVELGTYDLFCHIQDPLYEVADGFGANQEELTIVDEPIASIKDVKAVPATIYANNDNTTMLMVEFMDPVGANIANFTVTIKVRDPTDNETVLVDNKASGAGGLTVTKAGTDYTASYLWDPANDAVIGKYDLYAKIVTAAGWSDENGYGANVDELELMTRPIVSQPSFQNEDVDKEGKNHRFQITYKNTEEVGPDASGIVLVVGGQSYKMIEVDATDATYTDGKNYYFLLELGKGEHPYHFEVTDDEGQTASTAEKTVKVKKDTGAEDDLSAILGAVIGFIVVIIIVALVMYLLSRGGDDDKEKDIPHAEAIPVARPAKTEKVEQEPVEPEKEDAPVAEPVKEEAPETKPAEPVKEEPKPEAEAKKHDIPPPL